MFHRYLLLCAAILFTFAVCHCRVGSVFAQAYVSPCTGDCQNRVDQKFNAAKQLERQGEHERAAQMFAAVIAEEPLSIISQDSALHAGRCWEKAGLFTQAVVFYDTAISITNARSSEAGAKGIVLKRHRRDALFLKAGALERSGNQAAADLAYQQATDAVLADLAAENPSPSMRQESAVSLQQSGLQAGMALEEHGAYDRAIAAYDHVVAIGDGRADTADRGNIALILNAKAEALLRKATVCQAQGCVLEARQSIQRLYQEFPVSLQATKANVVEAALDGQNTFMAEQLVAQELQARSILDETDLLTKYVEAGVDAIRQVNCGTGVDGTIVVQLKIRSGQCMDNFWNIWVDDAAGRNFARWYGSGITVRGRIGTTSLVTQSTIALTRAWDELKLIITPAARKTEFFFNGESVGALSHQITGAIGEVARVRLERVNNPDAHRGVLLIDDLTVIPGGNVNPCLTESFDYPNGPLNDTDGWAGGADREIDVVQGHIWFRGRRYSRYDQAFVLLDRVIADFPDTAGALVALDKKGCALADLKRFDEAKAAFTQVLDRLRPTASQAEFFQTTRVHLRSLLYDEITTNLYAGIIAPNERWDQLRDLCKEIIAQDTRPDQVGWSWIVLIDSYNMQRRYAESGALAEQFLAEHNTDQFRAHQGEAHLFAAIADQAAGRFESSFTHLRWIISDSSVDPLTDVAKQSLTWAYHCLWWGLKQSGATEEVLTQVLNEYIAKVPEAPDRIGHWQETERIAEAERAQR